MAGKGPAPKDPSRRVRRNGRAVDTVLGVKTAPQPPLPEFEVAVVRDGVMTMEPFRWPAQTVAWWRMWAESELAKDFTAVDWSFLLDTALMHHAMWSKGQWTLAAEVRLRVAKFGATPEDRARLRITFADADEKDEKRSARSTAGARQRYGGASRAVASS